MDDDEYIIVPLPTINRHIRERGFDHIGRLASRIAAKRRSDVSRVLLRGNNAVQVGASEERRAEQAKTAYIASDKVNLEANYLLVDDV